MHKTLKKMLLFSLITLVIILILTVIIARTFFSAYHSESTSMLPTLGYNDIVFINKFDDTNKTLNLGDIVVYMPTNRNNTPFLKRVIGMPNDTIQLRNGRLIINGKTVKREFIEQYNYDYYGEIKIANAYYELLPNGLKNVIFEENDNGPLDNTRIYTVPENHYFMMGDNRDYSMDSRILNEHGFIPKENIIGKPYYILTE